MQRALLRVVFVVVALAFAWVAGFRYGGFYDLLAVVAAFVVALMASLFWLGRIVQAVRLHPPLGVAALAAAVALVVLLTSPHYIGP